MGTIQALPGGFSRRTDRRDARAILLLLVTVAGGGCAAPSGPSSTATPAPTPDPPNLVLLVTDDLDVPTTEHLTGLVDLIAGQGIAFTRAYVSMPVCGPARASILTGQYPHNHGVVSNHPPLGGFPAFRRHENSTIATWLRAAGYRTSFVGKYINDYPIDSGDGYIPPGWDDWYGHLSAYEDGRYFNYWVNDNGLVRRHGDRPEDYSADVETTQAVEFIHDSAGRPEPIFLYLAPEAPHIPANYPTRHGREFRFARAPRVPSFNESDVRDKPSQVRQRAPLTEADIEWLDKLQSWRLRSMLAVEDMIRAVIQALSDTGRLDNSYVVVTSDNGLLMGQHRLVHKKRNVYEETIRVPLMVRGPGVRVGAASLPVQLIDLAPTLLDLAGVPVPDSVDGRSLVPFLRGTVPDSWRTDVLIEINDTLAIRTPDWLYAEIGNGDLELYDMRRDPYQLQSLHNDVSPTFFAGFRDRMQALLTCRGSSCHP
jgi:arylsulfatase A-like enzyme